MIPHGHNTRTVKCNNYTLLVDKPTNGSSGCYQVRQREVLEFFGAGLQRSFYFCGWCMDGPPYKSTCTSGWPVANDDGYLVS